MNTISSRFRGCLAALGLAAVAVTGAGCASATDVAPTGTATDDVGSGAAPAAPPVHDPSLPDSPPAVASESIHRIKAPESRVVLGARIVIEGPAVKVTAFTRDTIWIQEADDGGACETSDDVVAYRAIRVFPSSPVPDLTVGLKIRVEGVVSLVDGRRAITSATIAKGASGVPYDAHCQRDGRALSSPALDDVLVLTAGIAAQTPKRSVDGSWAITTCFGETLLTIGTTIAPAPEDVPSSWQWVRGVLDRRSASKIAILPRDADDLLSHGHDDACL